MLAGVEARAGQVAAVEEATNKTAAAAKEAAEEVGRREAALTLEQAHFAVSGQRQEERLLLGVLFRQWFDSQGLRYVMHVYGVS
jgi:hypothetical protein